MLCPNYFLLADAQSAADMLWRKLCPTLLNQMKEVKKEEGDREMKILKEHLKEKKYVLWHCRVLTACEPPTINQMSLLSLWVLFQADVLSEKT